MSAPVQLPDLRDIERATPPAAVIDIRDPSTVDPVALVAGHLDGRATVMIYDSANVVPTFTLARRGAGIAVLDEAGDPVSVYADVRRALGHGLTRWPAYLEASAEEAIRAAMRPRKPRRGIRRALASLKGGAHNGC